MKYYLFILLFLTSLNIFSQDSSIIQNVIEQLNIEASKVNFDFVSSTLQPGNPTASIVVIPEIVVEEDDYLELDGHVLIVDNETGQITHHFFDRARWISDAIILSKITIDPTPYPVAKNKQAFGISTSYYSRSQPNPYSNTTISLFVESNDHSLKQILFDDIKKFNGEWDTQCAGESTKQNKELTVSTNQSNGYFDLLVANTITAAKTYVAENGECEEAEEVVSTIYTILKFDGTTYQKDYSYSPITVYPKVYTGNKIIIRQTPKGKALLHLDTIQDELILTVTEAQYGWLKVIKIISVEGDTIDIPGETGWIYCADVAISTRRDIELFIDPDRNTIAGTVAQETAVNIIDKYLNWVEIEYEGIRGWVKSYWLCGNPVTTCP